MWTSLLPTLEASHDVLAIDLPGFGQSPLLPPSLSPTVSVLADAVEQAMDDAGFETSHFAGNSLGGWLALELARRGRAVASSRSLPLGSGHLGSSRTFVSPSDFSTASRG